MPWEETLGEWRFSRTSRRVDIAVSLLSTRVLRVSEKVDIILLIVSVNAFITLVISESIASREIALADAAPLAIVLTLALQCLFTINQPQVPLE